MNRNHEEKEGKEPKTLMETIKSKEGKEAKERKSDCLVLKFPKKVLLFSAMPFTPATKTPFSLAHSYLSSTKDTKVIWVATDQPAEKVPQLFEEHGLDIGAFKDRLIFVDLVSAGAGVKRAEKSSQIHYVENPDNMVEISMLLADLFADKAVGLAVIDSVNGLLAFNSPSTVTKFNRFLPVIAEKTDTTILLVLMQGQFGSELEHAIQVTADALLSVEKGDLVIRRRTGAEHIKL